MTEHAAMLKAVALCDNAPYTESNADTYRFLSHEDDLLGRITLGTIDKLRSVTFLHVDDATRVVKIIDNTNLDDKFASLTRSWREQQTFSVLQGWRNELYSCYSRNGSVYFQIERSAACIFGLVTYGVHITGYCIINGAIKIWVPRRSYSKPTYPGKLDNTVAGGLGDSLEFFETAVKECSEEAGLDPALTTRILAQTGLVSYEFIDPETGYWQPEVQAVYDMALPPSVIPKPTDGEVAEFKLMSIPDILRLIAAGEFKYNCALVLIDFFVRHGVLTVDNTPGYIEILQRMRRRLPYPLKSIRR